MTPTRPYKINVIIIIIAVMEAVYADKPFAQEVIVTEGKEDVPVKSVLIVPFAFHSDTLGLSVGATAGARGWLQPQATLRGTVVGADTGSKYLFLGAEDLQFPWTRRLFVDVNFSIGEFSQIDIYQDGNPDYTDETAGSNDSDPDDFVEGEGNDNFMDIKFKYLLPIGYGRNNTKSTVVLRDGLRVAGGLDCKKWNPFTDGVSLFAVKFFYRNQDVEIEDTGEDVEIKTSGAEFSLAYNTTDFTVNPSRGSLQQISLARDWSQLDESNPWTTIDFSWSKYLSLGTGKYARERVLAFSFWIIDTPTWDEYDTEDGEKIYHRPPSYAGATIGGLDRMRGYTAGRFHSRSAVYYAAEYRHFLHWNPLRDMRFLHKLNVHVDWLQLAVFAEYGRVADEFDMSELHTDMKWSSGAGIRAFVNHLLVRIDSGVSEEDAKVQMTIGHPF